ncbi:YhbD family protein [Paenibacillus endoradicis]|uniref:YhbD family protein n=1 Tax=Paenibacillus endoradicis TaxID=2972487 RepID=UPI00215944DF|nr:YhbD family protein [Paenibacillus endoradicis]MCR8657382.1 YhbD family protein [Paenibacillus endoradicis]
MNNQEELISKKDLLLETGISYGQLYRWKRQGLIPDEWFMKQSAFTGQETFFPKRRMLERIHAILAKKDTHSLDDMAVLFSPISANRIYLLLDIIDAIDIKSEVADLCIQRWGKHRFTFQELLLIELFDTMKQDLSLSEEESEEWLVTARQWAQDLTGTDLQVIIYRRKSILQYMMLDNPSRYYLDQYSHFVQKYDLSERTKNLIEKLQKVMEG